MNEEERFDELIGSKLSEREFPFDDVNWDEAERLIVKQERWRRISLISLIFSAGLVAGIAIMLPFIATTHSTLPLIGVSTNTNAVSPNNIPSATDQSKVSGTKNIQNAVKASPPVQSAFVKRNNSTGSGTAPNNLTSLTKQPKEVHSLLTKESGTSTAIQNQPNTGLTIAVTKTTVSSQQKQPDDNKEQSSALIKNNNNQPPAATNKATANETPPTDVADVNKNNSAGNSLTTNNSSESVKTIPANTSPPNNTGTAIKTKKDSNNANSPPSLLPAIAKKDTATYSANILSLYAGGTYSFGWNNSETKEADGITPWAGLNYTHYFSSLLSASIGIGYSELNHLDKTYTSSIIQYDFGASAQVITVTPQSIYYLAFPVNIKFNVDSKDRVDAGFDYLIMLTTSSTLTSYQQTYFGESSLNTEKENGYTQGFSNNDFQLTLSYTRMFTKRLGIGMEGYMGIVSVENNSFPGITQYGKNEGLRFILSYQLIK